MDDFIYIFTAMVNYKGWRFKYILLDTEQYRFNQREVFEDRLPVGWMLYLPVKIKHEDVPSAYKIFDIESNTELSLYLNPCLMVKSHLILHVQIMWR
ncbi:hypothetical protein FNH72_22515 [Salmonella enterica subsp. arizonae]|nr:hypothetical protein [Salmonella enterica subsp. arizonae]ECC7020878.1 hypothetical protein [Salmonella enterica]EDY0807171.1 hypothetical protein [Salmonella enterica subsp. arizonae serovar 62:z4,z23:-]EEE2583648.1 hypothetical protein [Salmonella enterica subsp. arizonae serovar 56:z4,z23:-]ECG8548416.1 hypothetical protein [Salmonella enterica subsp. arizonae]